MFSFCSYQVNPAFAAASRRNDLPRLRRLGSARDGSGDAEQIGTPSVHRLARVLDAAQKPCRPLSPEVAGLLFAPGDVTGDPLPIAIAIRLCDNRPGDRSSE
jgi:hypothetical protein